MKFGKISTVYFSATGTTKKVVEGVASQFTSEKKTFDLLRKPPEIEIQFGADELVIVGMPVYAGRIPALCATMLAKLKGHNTPAIAVVTYGNREYEDALLELKAVLEANGFVVFGAAAFVAQHSIFPAVGHSRPDESDNKKISDFARQCEEKLTALTAPVSVNVKGNSPYRKAGSVPLKPTGNKKCNACGACVKICPTKAIPSEAPRKTDKDRCISCAACISICPQSARRFGGLLYPIAAKSFAKNNSLRKEPEIFI